MKTAVVLFNLGGPDAPEAVEPFLFNLFNDKAIIGAPAPIRWLIAKLISKRRAPVARAIYARIGGKSPLLGLTQDQAAALESALNSPAVMPAKVFVAMRYWHPLTERTVAEVKAWGPDRIVLLPLYPQYSTTTSGSSIARWRQEAAAQGLAAPTTAICCYPTKPGLVAAIAGLIETGLAQASASGKPRVLFSAHGLPEKIVASGDPYQWQVEQTAAAVVAQLQVPDLDWIVCYQSRVGPMKWIGPSTEHELMRAARDRVPVVVVPVAFVSEHSETLVELDLEYRDLAVTAGVPAYVRVPAVGTDPAFIGGLAGLVRQALTMDCEPCSQAGGRLCPAGLSRCPNGGGAA